MIAPRTNLVAWAAAIIVPLSIFAGVVGSLRSICVLGIVVFALTSLVDLLLGLGKLRQLDLQIPAVNRVTAGREFGLDLKLNGTGLPGGVLRIALDLPPSVKADQSSISLRIKAVPWFILSQFLKLAASADLSLTMNTEPASIQEMSDLSTL